MCICQRTRLDGISRTESVHMYVSHWRGESGACEFCRDACGRVELIIHHFPFTLVCGLLLWCHHMETPLSGNHSVFDSRLGDEWRFLVLLQTGVEYLLLMVKQKK